VREGAPTAVGAGTGEGAERFVSEVRAEYRKKKNSFPFFFILSFS
jgi:hypothetical protein